MGISRSTEIILVAYFLSRCSQHHAGNQKPSPPLQLKVNTWKNAYELFFPKLNRGRTKTEFHNTMKASRDTFDGHHDSGRKGWQENGENKPKPLGRDEQHIWDQWQGQSVDVLWQTVEIFLINS